LDDAKFTHYASVPEKKERAEESVRNDCERRPAGSRNPVDVFTRAAPALEKWMENSVECEDDEEYECTRLREECEHTTQQSQKIERTPLHERAILQLETLGEETCEHEQCSEHVLAPHHPTDGFHVDREDCKAERHTRACSCAAGRAPKQEVEETDIERVEDDVPEVIAERIPEAVKAGIDRPTQVTHEKRLFTREVSDEDFSEAREERVFVVEIGVFDEDTGVVESDELVAQGARKPEQRECEERQKNPGVDGVELESLLVRQGYFGLVAA
jgi:hypothetical protein